MSGFSVSKFTNWDCIKGGGGIHGKEGQMPGAQATGVGAGPTLHMCTSQLSSPLFDEAMDDEPGLLGYLETGCLQSLIWIRGKENQWHTQKGFHVSVAQPLWPVSFCPISARSNATALKFSKSYLFQEAHPDLSCPTFTSQESLPLLGLVVIHGLTFRRFLW